MNPLTLPDAILLQVFLYSDVPTIKNLLLTNKHIKNLIAAYETSISKTAFGRLHSHHDIARFLPLGYSVSGLSIGFMIKIYNRIEITKWLSGVLLEQHCEHIVDCIYPGTCSCNVSAEDPRGDKIRARIAVAWSVLWHMADIANMVEKGIRRLAGFYQAEKRLKVTELVIRREWITYAKSLSMYERREHNRMEHWIFPMVFCNPKVRPDVWEAIPKVDRPNTRIYTSALLWAYMHEGPSFFREAWSSKEGNQRCAERLAALWNAKSPELQELCCQTATEVGDAFDGTDHEERRLLENDLAKDYYDLIRENDKHPELMIGSFRDIPYQIVPKGIDTSRIKPLVPSSGDDSISWWSSDSSNN